MYAFLTLVSTVINIYIWLLIAQAVLSWLVAFGVANRHHRLVSVLGDFLWRITEPLLRPIRRVLPDLGGIDVSPVFLCGQSALAYAIGQLPQTKRRDETDYQFLDGIGIEMQYGVGKVAKDRASNVGAIGTLKDWGMVTGFVASVPDA